MPEDSLGNISGKGDVMNAIHNPTKSYARKTRLIVTFQILLL